MSKNEGSDEQRKKELYEKARPIAEAKNVFAAVVAAMRGRGFAGEDCQAELLYAVLTSRLLKRPMCVLVKGPSPSDNATLLNRTLELLPPETYLVRSGYLPQAIGCEDSDLSHRALVVQEAAGLSGTEGRMLLRTLLAEGKVRWEWTQARWVGRAAKVKCQGPIALVMATAEATVSLDDETRVITMTVEDIRHYSRDVADQICREFAGELAGDAVDLNAWHAYQLWLQANQREVVIPFARGLSQVNVPMNRLRHALEQILSAVTVSALLHQATRAKDDRGRVIATIEDYVRVARFLERPFNEAIGSAIPHGVRELVWHLLEHTPAMAEAAVTALPPAHQPRGLNLVQLAQKMNIDKSAAQRRAQKAMALGLAVDLGGGRGNPCRLVPVVHLRDDINVLPAGATVEKQMQVQR
jgi:hypothetical protein